MRSLGHVGRVLLIWLVSSAIVMTLVAIFLTPHLPPGTASKEASGQRFDNEVLTLVSVLICMFVFTFFGYALVAFRARDERSDGPPVRGHMRTQTTWVAITTTMVLFLAAFGTYELLGGSGGGQGSKPVFVPSALVSANGTSNPPLQVQVIGQQWQFTYRYPDNGGFESASLVLPVDRQVELHVTSLDVIHSFWVPSLGLKADANPGADNIAYITPTKTGTFDLRCAELCGLYHGYMFDTLRVVSAGDFDSFVKSESQLVAPVMHYMPAYSHVYLPDPTFRAG